MPAPCPTLTPTDATRLVTDAGFTPAASRRVGIELEWLTFPIDDPATTCDPDTVMRVASSAPRPGGSRLTFEPGGQLELSSAPLAGVGRATDAIARDAAAVAHALEEVGVGLVATGLDPLRPGGRVVDGPRYTAMEAFFDADGPDGRTMMRTTAALQVNVDLGRGDDAERRWQLAHDLGPTLAATFANSPIARGAPTGRRSTRLAVWSCIDPSRTAPAALVGPRGPDAWACYALDARVMLIRESSERFVPLPAPMSFMEWIERGHELGYPTEEDLAYHLTTLFPPVRPRGWLELRMIDALPDPWWRVAAAVTVALLDDPSASSRAQAAARPARDRWDEAARDGLSDPVLATSAARCFAAALDALPRLDTDRDVRAAAAAFMEHYVSRGRCPADDRLDAWEDGEVVPARDRFREPTWA